MPRPTPKSQALARTAQVHIAQARASARWFLTLPAAVFDRPVSTNGATVHDVIARAHWQAIDLVLTLQQPTSMRAVSLEQYLRSLRDAASYEVHAAADIAGRLPGPDLAREFSASIEHLDEAVRGELAPVIETRYDAVRTVDVLRGRLLELLLATDDVARAVGVPAPLERAALTDVARSYSDVVGALYPGRSVELRVPPATAVQLATAEGGPTHKRGTPPTVVETDPLTFIRLCSGRVPWGDALREHRVTASGAHADLSGVFPVLATL